MLRAYVREARDPGFGIVVSLRELGSRRTLLKTGDNKQHLILRDRRHVIQVFCRGADIQADPFAIELVVDQFPEVESRLRMLKAMANIYRQRRIGRGTGAWTVEAMRHRDALAALDRRMEEYSYRQIAVFLYGEKSVRDDWTAANQSMKNRVIRSVRRGFRMMKGGYRTLLN